MITLNEFVATICRALGRLKKPIHVPKSAAKIAAAGFELAATVFKFDPPLTGQRIRFFTENHAFSIDKARQELGYQPGYCFKDGLQETIFWYRKHGMI